MEEAETKLILVGTLKPSGTITLGCPEASPQ